MAIALTDLTNGSTGVFDILMDAVSDLLDTQYESGRLTGSDFANVLLGTTQSAMAQAIQYLAIQAADDIAELQSAKDLLVKDAQILDIEESVDVKTQQIASMIVDDTVKQAQSEQDILNKAAQVTSMVANDVVSAAQASKIGKDEDLVDEQILSEKQNILILTEKAEAAALYESSLMLAQQTDITANTATKTQQIASMVIDDNIKQEQSTKDLLVKAAQILDIEESIDVKTQQIASMVIDDTLKQEQSDKDLETKSVQIDNIQNDTSIKESQSVQDLANKQIQEKLISQQALTEIQNTAMALAKATAMTANESELAAATVDKVEAEVALLKQKAISEFAQTEMEAITDTVDGVLGSQKSLYDFQTAGFKNKAAIDAFKTLADLHSVYITTSEDPIVLTAAGIDGVLYGMAKEIYNQANSSTPTYAVTLP